jgi:hypothetical protein
MQEKPPLQKEWQKNLSDKILKLMAKTWLDNSFKEKFITHPKVILEEEGIHIPEDVEVQIEQPSSHWQIEIKSLPMGNICKIPLPPKPASLADEDLSAWIYRKPPSYLPKFC